MTNEELVAEYQKGNEAAFNELLEQNIGIIHYMVNQWFQNVKNGKVTEKDLENECTFGFWLAVKSYKSDNDVPFGAYAFKRIKWHLCRTLITKSPKTATGEDVHVVSFDDTVPGTDNLTVGDTIEDEEAEQLLENLFNGSDQQSLHDDLMQLLDALVSNTEKQILLMHYGIGCKPCSQADIGEQLEISGSRVGQMETSAMKKIQSSPVTAYFADKYNRAKVKSRKQIITDEHNQRVKEAIKSNKKSISEAMNFFGI